MVVENDDMRSGQTRYVSIGLNRGKVKNSRNGMNMLWGVS